MINSSVIGHADREERIRQLAFQLWQTDGSPEGKAEEYWFRAAQIIDEDLSDSGLAPPISGTAEAANVKAPADADIGDRKSKGRRRAI